MGSARAGFAFECSRITDTLRLSVPNPLVRTHPRYAPNQNSAPRCCSKVRAEEPGNHAPRAKRRVVTEAVSAPQAKRRGVSCRLCYRHVLQGGLLRKTAFAPADVGSCFVLKKAFGRSEEAFGRGREGASGGAYWKYVSTRTPTDRRSGGSAAGPKPFS